MISGASAAELVPADIEAPEIIGLKSNDSEGVLTTTQWDNPYGCYGQSDKPHKSTHVPSTVNAVARTDCRFTEVPYIMVKSTLHKRVWWGWDARKTNSNSDTNDYLVTTNVASDCEDGHWRITSYHEIVGRDGNTYSANTMNEDDNINGDA